MIKTIKFRNKKTGEIKTQISIMEMSQYEVLKTYRILNRKTNEWATVEETNAIYFTIDLDSASMLLTEDHELEKENLQRMGNPPVVIRSTEGEPTQMWKDINEITQDFYTTDDPDDCDFISSGEMFLIDDEYNRDEILNIVKEYV